MCMFVDMRACILHMSLYISMVAQMYICVCLVVCSINYLSASNVQTTRTIKYSTNKTSERSRLCLQLTR